MEERIEDLNRHALGENLLLLTDSYKVTHWKQYPPGTTNVYSYFESRGGAFGETLFFGPQYLIKRYLEGKVVSERKINEAEEMAALHFGDGGLFNREGWEYVLDVHGGRLPISIRAVEEGAVVPTHNVLMTVENTDPNCFWLTNYLETLLVQTWYPTTVATQSLQVKRRILENLKGTGNPELADFKLHDFGFRGVSSVESAGIGGAAHLINFRGTDTMAALVAARDYYHEKMAGFSIPAAEHSTMTSWGRDHEEDAMRNMLEQFPKGLVAVVSDSYDIYAACRDIWGERLREKVIGRDGALVVRPDSGNPPEVVGKVLDILGEKFGSAVNVKGYRVLNDKIRVIQGDGIDYAMVCDVYGAMERAGWSGDNVGFGSGGANLQKVNRDTLKFAFKCSSIAVGGEEREVYKEPVTDPGKNSKRGRMKLVVENGEYATVPENHPGRDELVEVFRDGRILRDYTLEEVRRRATAGLERLMARA